MSTTRDARQQATGALNTAERALNVPAPAAQRPASIGSVNDSVYALEGGTGTRVWEFIRVSKVDPVIITGTD